MLHACEIYFPKFILHFYSKYFCSVGGDWSKENEHLLSRHQAHMQPKMLLWLSVLRENITTGSVSSWRGYKREDA